MVWRVAPAMAYVAGTAFAEKSSVWAEGYARSLDHEESSIQALKALIHCLAYISAYRLAYAASPSWQVEAESAMSQQQAFEILGLGQYAKFKEVHQRYRELALLHHPDKCQIDCERASAKMAAVNSAYSILKKKFA